VPLIVDPDDLSQGTSTAVPDAVWGTPSGATVTITSAGSNLPALATGEFFEVRDHSNALNNGLYQASGAPTTASVTADKVSSPATPAAAGSEAVTILGTTGATTAKSVFFDVDNRKIRLLDQGKLSTDGVTHQALYSFSKEEWKNDNVLNPYDFPFVPVTPEQFEWVDDWEPNSTPTVKRVRTGGWRELKANGVLKREYVGVISLGTFEDSAADLAYYQQGNDPTDTAAATNFTFAGPLNEAIESYNLITPADPTTGFAITGNNTITRNDGGNWITQGYRKGGQISIITAEDTGNNGTFEIASVTSTVITVVSTPLTNNGADTTMQAARNFRNRLKLFLRIRDADPNGKTFSQSDLPAIGVTALTNQAYRFPLSNVTDLKIAATDATIAASSPYTQILVRYFDQAFSRPVDSATPRNFGIVIDVGTHSGVDGATSGAGSTLTSAEGGITGANYTDGVLVIHEGADAGTYTISGTPTATVVTITTTFPTGASNSSFTLQRAAPIVATAEQIYEKVQYLLRQAADIDTTDQTVTGRTGDGLLAFVGDTLKSGTAFPSNPNGGGSGVIIEGFSANDTNRLVFVDNSIPGIERTYPFVAAGTINWNLNLQNDTQGTYWMFYEYTERFTNTGFSLTGASGSNATLNSATTNLVAELANGDYIRLAGWAAEANNGIWQLTGAPGGGGPWTAAIRKVDNATVANESAGPSISLDKKPIGSPQALLVKKVNSSDITGSTFGASSATFDFDYDGNVQGGRTAGTDAAIILRAIGFTAAQYVEATGTIIRAVGLSFTMVSPLERNYSNP
jgi:hypothetical protein